MPLTSIASPAGPQRAFTLLELLTVMVIIAILAGLTVGAGRRASETGRNARAKAELAVLAAALETYQRTYGDYPQTDDAARLLQSLIGRRDPHNNAIVARSLLDLARFTTDGTCDPFADPSVVLLDPWGQPYRYIYKNQALWTNPGYVLFSSGPDGGDSGTLLTGGYADPAPPVNADNLYANR